MEDKIYMKDRVTPKHLSTVIFKNKYMNISGAS